MKIDNNITFTDRDEFSRIELANQIKRLIEENKFHTILNTSPLLINGSWGTGKTEFCYKLANFLKKEIPDSIVIYYNAFDKDYLDNPLLSLMTHILYQINDKQLCFFQALNALTDSIAKLATFGSFYSFEAAMAKKAADFASKITKALIEYQTSLEKFKSKLNDSDKKLVIIVDELDRCKPTFALKLIEYIKHIFDVNGAYFILSANKDFLSRSVRHEYGSAFNGDKYFDKYIMLELQFPCTNTKIQRSNSSIYFEQLIEDLDLKESIPFYKNAASIFENTEFYLRDIEKFVRALYLYKIYYQSLTLIEFFLIYHKIFYPKWFLDPHSSSPKYNPMDQKYGIVIEFAILWQITSMDDKECQHRQNFIDNCNFYLVNNNSSDPSLLYAISSGAVYQLHQRIQKIKKTLLELSI